jgi:hypothetical protein
MPVELLQVTFGVDMMVTAATYSIVAATKTNGKM